MARKTNYGFEKRQKEIAQKAKQAEKIKRKREQDLQPSAPEDAEKN